MRRPTKDTEVSLRLLYDWFASACKSQYEELIEADLALLWSIQDWVYRRPWLDSRLARIVHKHPWNDVCVLVWLFAALGVYEFGAHHFWMVATNLLMAFVLRKLIKAKRPVEYDERLQPMTDLFEESYGFPSMESYMSVVVMAHFVVHSKMKVLMIPVAIFVVFIVGFSRVYARSRFPHQVVGSWLLAFVGMAVGAECCNRMDFRGMHKNQHYTCIAIAIAAFLANLGLAIENNESRISYIPKKEFLRVLVDIINGSNEASAATERVEDVDEAEAEAEASFHDTRAPSAPTTNKLPLTPRAAALRRAKLSEVPTRYTTGKRPKRDSFYFLQKSLEDRELKRTTGSTRNPLSLSSPRSAADSDDHEHIA